MLKNSSSNLQYREIEPTVNLPATAIWKPEKAKELSNSRTIRDNGVRGVSWLEWVTLAVTSGAFGAARLGCMREGGRSTRSQLPSSQDLHWDSFT
jgi:hypothetical protein